MDLPQNERNSLATGTERKSINHGRNGGSRGVTIPPGFSGDALRAVSSSAPPPGFYALAEQQQRDQAAAMVLQKPWGGYDYTTNDEPDEDATVEDDYDVHFGLLEEQRRSMSYMNLAEAIGESMAQSMEDSFVSGASGVKNRSGTETAAPFGKSITTNEPSFHQIASNSFLLSGPDGNNNGKLHNSSNRSSYVHNPSSGSDSLSFSQQERRGTTTLMAPVGGGRKVQHSSSTSLNDGGLENIHRQSRHIASRLIGPKLTSSHLFTQSSTSSPHQFYSGGNPLLDRFLSDSTTSNDVFTGNGNFNDSAAAAATGSATTAPSTFHDDFHTKYGGSFTTSSKYDPLRRTIEEPLGSAIPHIERAHLSENSIDMNGSNVLVEDGYVVSYPRDEQQAAVVASSTPESSTTEVEPQHLADIKAVGSSSSLRRALDAARSGSAPPQLPYSAFSGSNNSNTDDGFTCCIEPNRTTPDFNSLGLQPSSAAAYTTNTDQLRSSYISSTTNSNSPATAYHDRDDSILRSTEKDLAPFLRETLEPITQYYNKTAAAATSTITQRPTTHPSRSLCILASGPFLMKDGNSDDAAPLSVSQIRSICESFGVLESFRSDFWQSRHVLFFSYYDLRCAQRAASGLLPALLRRVESISGSAAAVATTSNVSLKVKYCVPLQNSSPADDSTLLITNLPPHIDEQNIHSYMESFGGVRSVHYVAPTNVGSLEDESTSYMVEFYDIQDSKHALMEMQSTAPWGVDVTVEVGIRNPTKRRQARDLLRLLGRWRLDERPSWTPPGELPSDVPKSGGLEPDHGEVKVSTPNSVSPLPSVIASTPSPSLAPAEAGANPKGKSKQGKNSSTVSPFNTKGVNDMHKGKQYGTVHSQIYPANVHSIPTEVAQHYQMNSHAPVILGADGQYSFLVHPNNFFAQTNRTSRVNSSNVQQSHYIQDHASTVSMHQSSYWPHQSHQAIQLGNSDQLGHTGISSGVRDQRMSNMVVPSFIDLRTGLPVGGPIYIPSVSVPQADGSASTSSDSLTHSHNLRTNNEDGLYFPSDPSCFSNSKSCAKNSIKKPAHKGSLEGQRPPTQQDASLLLDINAVINGTDARTSLMVRNIPNKYTQRMLLSEFQQNGYGPDKIDFFYLPIDFKNKCNRGYAFVNFVDYKDIIPFFNQYNQKSWKVFNSDKICDVTYARIQGKAAMLRRFEHSALFEKDDEYRPLAFVSHGPNKGQPEEFLSPLGVNRASEAS